MPPPPPLSAQAVLSPLSGSLSATTASATGDAALARTVQQLRQRGCSVVLVTHRPDAMELDDRLLLLHQGRVQAHGPRDAVLAALRAAGQPGAAPKVPSLLPSETL